MPAPRLAVIRQSDFQLQRMAGDRVEVHAAAGVSLPPDCGVVLTRYPPGSRTPPHVNAGGEHHVVLSGTVQAGYEDRSFRFEPGDYFYWDGRSEHAVWNEGDGEALVLTIRVPLDG